MLKPSLVVWGQGFASRSSGGTKRLFTVRAIGEGAVGEIKVRVPVGTERDVLFNDALNTLYLRLYGQRERNVLFNDTLNTFINRYMGTERDVLFNDALNTFYLRLYGEREKCFI